MQPPSGFDGKSSTDPPSCQPPTCPTCGQPLQGEGADASSNQPESHPARLDLRTITDRLAGDAEFATQIERLIELSLASPAWGANLRADAYCIATHPLAKAWLERSDELADALGGRRDLLRWRRRGVLRHLHPPVVGLPLAEPLRGPTPPGEETRLFELHDELEWLPIVGLRTPEGWRPKQNTITHTQARAILGWKAQRLDTRLSRGFVPGYDHESRSRREVRIDVVDFLSWSIVRKRVA
jgi:hypothetical protein